ncbi:MAG: hypothetical protein H8K09_13270 [Nitrospira sp.]|nr:hypothetical protein [Nitrospira sp.]
MNSTKRPNVRWQQHGAGVSTVSAMNRQQWDAPSADLDRAINRRAYAVTGLIVAVLVTILMNLNHLPDFWGGFTAGVITLAALGLGALAIGACLGGARLSDVPRPGTGDRGMPR